jgi:hypothetical protein
MHLLAVEFRLKIGSMDYLLAHTAAECRAQASMLYDMQTKILHKIGISPDGMPKLINTDQLQRMQDKADAISKLQRELQNYIQAYKLSRLQDDDISSGVSNSGTNNKGTTRQVEDVVLWEQGPPGPGVPHTMVTKKGKWKHWCPHHLKWTKHTPEECRIQLETKEDSHDNGTLTASLDKVIILATQRCNLMVEKNEWALETPKKDKIIAM